MLDSLREAFRQAVENFRTELHRDEVPEAADRLLRAMKRELVQTRVALKRLEETVERTEGILEREAADLRTCLRREELARRIGDAETARIAHDFARRHLRRTEWLEEKLGVLRRELQDRRTEQDEMEAEFRRARVRRETLAASAGRTGARERIREADDLFSEVDRMAARIQEMEDRAGAARALDEALGQGPRTTGSDRTPDRDLDARLEALKRRMERQ